MSDAELKLERTGERSAKMGRWNLVMPAGIRWVAHCNALEEWSPHTFEDLEDAAAWVREREESDDD